jgi:arsenate reductase
MSLPIRVLFLCTGNSARSLIAEALLKDIGGDDFEVQSAGVEPKGINPFTTRVLRDAGLPTESLESKDMERFIAEDFDYVITVCDNAAERCPVFLGAPERIHWSFPDPATVEGDDVVKLHAFQEILFGMRRRLEPFVTVARRAAFAEPGSR